MWWALCRVWLHEKRQIHSIPVAHSGCTDSLGGSEGVLTSVPGKTYPLQKLFWLRQNEMVVDLFIYPFECHWFHHKLINIWFGQFFFQTIENNTILFFKCFIWTIIHTFSVFDTTFTHWLHLSICDKINSAQMYMWINQWPLHFALAKTYRGYIFAGGCILYCYTSDVAAFPRKI